MTEQEWLKGTDPVPMLEFLRRQTSDRKLRLYLCGGCRQIVHLFYMPESLTAVEVAERFVDGKATKTELDRAEWDAEIPTFGYAFNESFWHMEAAGTRKSDVLSGLVEMQALAPSALRGGKWAVDEDIKERLVAAAELAEYCAVGSPRESDWGLKHTAQVDWPGRWLFDCVFGNPFRHLTIDPSVLNWQNGLIVLLARAAYDQRHLPAGILDRTRLAVLADALEEPGCGDADMLLHLRGPGPHVRGCFALDVLLGKQ